MLGIWFLIVHTNRRSTATILEPVWVVNTLISRTTASHCDDLYDAAV